MIWFKGTPVALGKGMVVVTKGATATAVVKFQTKLAAKGVPAVFLAPVVMVPV